VVLGLLDALLSRGEWLMGRSFDVVITGAGIMGLSTAYYLKKKGCDSILVLEKEESWITGSSARANGGIRQQFSNPLNIQLTQISLPVFKDFESTFRTNIAFRQYGYLFVTSSEEGEKTLRENLETQRLHGVPVEWLSPEQISQLAPYLKTDDLRGGNFCAEDGYGDSYSIAAGFGQAAIELGAVVETRSPVVEVISDSGTVTGVSTEAETVSTFNLVNAAGPYASIIGRLAGVRVPVEPVRRMIVMTEVFPPIPDGIPMIIDVDSGYFMRTESGRVLMGWSDPDEPTGYNTAFDPAFVEVVAEKAVERVPILKTAQINTRKSWAGLYANSPDRHCILGEAPNLRGFYLANGFSGHGMMHAPAVGMILADLILDGKTDLIDLEAVSLARFEGQYSAGERIVI
jgi:sarcosine oxidase subunit beta